MIFLFQLFLVFTIVPHELGHALMARLIGMRVFKIYIGSGGTLFACKLFGFPPECISLSTGGGVVTAHRSLKKLCANLFVFILAGPVFNLLLAAVVWLLLCPGSHWYFKLLDHGFQPALMPSYADLAFLLESRWKRDVATQTDCRSRMSSGNPLRSQDIPRGSPQTGTKVIVALPC